MPAADIELHQLERQVDGTFVQVEEDTFDEASQRSRCFRVPFAVLIVLTVVWMMVVVGAFFMQEFQKALQELAQVLSAGKPDLGSSVAAITASSTLALATATAVPFASLTPTSSHVPKFHRYFVLPGAAAEVIKPSAMPTSNFWSGERALERVDLHYSLLHNAYPIHTANRVDPHIGRQVKHNLKECGEHLAKRTRGGALLGPNIGQTFENELLQCKAAVAEALHNYYGQGHDQDRRTHIKAPRQVNPTNLQTHTEARRTSSKETTIAANQTLGAQPPYNIKFLQDPKCVADFCDWMNNALYMDRCFYRNESAASQPDWNNHTSTDFKRNAPLECYLCLPNPDRGRIVDHCKDVANREKSVLWVLVGTLVALPLGTLMFWLALRL